MVSLLFAISVLFATAATVLPSSAIASTARILGPAQVIDGDTLEIGVVRIRLHGVDAPEAGQTCRRDDGTSWQCGTEATRRLAELVEGKQLECLALDRDAYGRIVATCTADGVEVNGTLVDEGLAWAFTRYSQDFVEIEAMARAARRGIWQGSAQPPWDYRADRWHRAAEASPRPGCPIKGNINRDGERIYHTPWSPWYNRVSIDEEAGERWFCDEAEAQSAGWRPARWR